ncbi:MAG: hypothetical protein Kow00109_18180 [Acidobacteriota bacterium]
MRKKILVFSLVAVLSSPCSSLLAQTEGSHSASQVESKVVLNGLDPVELARGKQVEGKPQWKADHDGFTYYFASAENLQAFRDNPAKYSVQDHGNCPVAKVMMGKTVKGKPDIFAVYEGKTYLFLEPKAKEMFLQNPKRFVKTSPAKSAPREGSGF